MMLKELMRLLHSDRMKSPIKNYLKCIKASVLIIVSNSYGILKLQMLLNRSNFLFKHYSSLRSSNFREKHSLRNGSETIYNLKRIQIHFGILTIHYEPDSIQLLLIYSKMLKLKWVF